MEIDDHRAEVQQDASSRSSFPLPDHFYVAHDLSFASARAALAPSMTYGGVGAFYVLIRKYLARRDCIADVSRYSMTDTVVCLTVSGKISGCDGGIPKRQSLTMRSTSLFEPHDRHQFDRLFV